MNPLIASLVSGFLLASSASAAPLGSSDQASVIFEIPLESVQGFLNDAEEVGATIEPLAVLKESTLFAAEGTADELATLDTQAPGVAEPDQTFTIAATQPGAPVNLDRLDRGFSPPDGVYAYPDSAGSTAIIYVVDTGVAPNVSEYNGRLGAGYSPIDGGNGLWDCNGHGTHVAGIAASASWGVAKQATVVPIRVLGCDGSGAGSDVIAGVQWIMSNHPAGRPGIINMSITANQASPPVDAVTQSAIDSGFIVVAAAGNAAGDACGASPGRVPGVITVAAVDANDVRSSFSNFGSCVDIFAPGGAIRSLQTSGGTVQMSGTSQAAPHAAGVVALRATLQGAGGLSPAMASDSLRMSALTGVVGNAGAGSPNHLLQSPQVLGFDAEARAFVRVLFVDFLGREPTSSELDGMSAELASGQLDRYGAATRLSRSDEWISTVIGSFYRDTLGREPDSSGLSGWVAAARNGMPVAQIASAFYSSQEYYMSVGRGDPATWVDDLYRKLLLRAPDSAGLAGWVDALRRGMPRDTLSFGFYQSGETLGVRITKLYRTLLGRDPEPGAIANWSPFVANQGDLVLAAALAGSSEYYNRAHTR